MASIENAVVNNVLCYLSSARHIVDEQSLVASCMTFYSNDVIFEAKEVLCNCTGKEITKRRGDGKVKAHIIDMLAMLRQQDEDDAPLPTFLCNGYNKMPPANGFDVITEHLVGLVTEVSALKEEVRLLKNTCQKNPPPTEKLLHINRPQGANKSSKDGGSSQATGGPSQKHPTSSKVTSYSATLRSSNIKGHVLRDSQQNNLNPEANVFVSKRQDENNLNSQDMEEDPTPTNSQANGDGHGNWQEQRNRRRRPKNTIRGSRQSLGQFKGVEDTKDLYVGRCHVDTNVNHIIDHIKNEFKMEPIKCEIISNENLRVKSFKVTVLSGEIEKLLHPDSWPKDVRVRKFYSGFSRKDNNTH